MFADVKRENVENDSALGRIKSRRATLIPQGQPQLAD